MCAIAGLWHSDCTNGDALRAEAGRIGSALAHRGPDDEGYWLDAQKGLALVHRRLAILDLSPAGHQPMVSRNDRYVIAFNGECYNFEELQKDLLSTGHALRGRSDTEVILESFALFGIEPVVKRMAGMFAIALWDKSNSTLTLIRDRLGKKPLYYGLVKGVFLFASELKAFPTVLDRQLSLDPTALGLFLQMGYIPGPLSVFKEIRKLPAGHILTLKSPTAIPASTPYWTVQGAFEAARSAQTGVSEEDATQKFQQLLGQCVRERMISDVPLGAFLSGGVDSSLVVALMQAQSTRRVRTFSIAFQEPEFNEGPHARLVAEHLGTEHTELFVTGRDAQDLVPRLPEIYDEPFADASQIPTCLLCQLTRRHVTVSLSGDGGDELFLGYSHYEQAARRIDLMMALPVWGRRMFGNAMRATPERVLDGLCRGFRKVSRRGGGRLHSHYLLKYANALSQTSALGMYLAVSKDWFNPAALLRRNGDAGPQDLENPVGVDSDNTVELFGLCDLALYIPDDILVKVDRASMAWALEVRAPILDHRFVEFALGLPFDLKRRDGIGKWLMRETLYKFVPRRLVDRPKKGFSVPISEWLRGPLRDWAEALLTPERLCDQDLLDAEIVRSRWEEHLSGRQDWGRLIWNIIVLQSWLQRWMNTTPSKAQNWEQNQSIRH